MNAHRVLVLAALGPLATLAALRVVRASDHLDGPRVTADPQSDVTDVFAFTSPADPTRVVLAMAVAPYATDASTFSPLVDYAFRVQLVAAMSPPPPPALAPARGCVVAGGAAPPAPAPARGGLAPPAAVGDTNGGTTTGAAGTMRVFAGLRSDPASFDRQGALATVATGRASFTGQNAFAGADVLAIVVEVSSSVFTLVTEGGTSPVADAGNPNAEAGSPILAVAAETYRRGM